MAQAGVKHREAYTTLVYTNGKKLQPDKNNPEKTDRNNEEETQFFQLLAYLTIFKIGSSTLD